MNILIIGSGGREHALAAQIVKSPRATKIFAAPGNAGMAELATCVAISPEDVHGLAAFALKQKIDLTIVGPELPLTLGVVDVFEAEGLKIFGPSRRASILEGSKIFTKEFCGRHGIPTAPFRVFDEAAAAREFLLARKEFPVVVKADGLAAGKGVVVAQNREEADKAVCDMMTYERFGTAGRKIVIEDFLNGEEASFIVATDGVHFVTFPPSQDHKRVFEGDQGPNTGGMGAYAPAPIVTREVYDRTVERIIKPALAGLAAEDRPYRGFLYAGLMIDDRGEPQLIEFNCRLGDPEAEVILPLLESDFIELALAAIEGRLDACEARFSDGACAGVVLASAGYPASYEKGQVIHGISAARDLGCDVFHSGTSRKGEAFVTAGGRVLVVAAKGQDLAAALDQVYGGVAKISWDGMHYRKDIGAKGLQK